VVGGLNYKFIHRRNKMTKGFSIFVFAYGGSVYNATGAGIIDEDIINFFVTEDDAWKTLSSLHGLNPDLLYTVLPVAKFV
jgi:hypothetical protein